jgi:cell division protein FtsI (penicillin-binding protein 3)
MGDQPNRSQLFSPFKRRAGALAVLLCLWIVGLGARLFQLQIAQYGEWLTRALRQRQRTIEVSPKRGILYDRNFRELAMSVSADSVFAVPADIPAPETAAQLLGRVLATDPSELLGRIQGSGHFCWIKRKVDPLEAERVRALNLKGIYFQKENKRFYPKGELAAHVLGYVGLDENGLAGIELELDKQVRGRPGKLLIQADARRRWYGRAERPPDPGENVVLTLDEKIQFIAERELGAVVDATRALTGTVIVLNPASGEILAMANRPTFDPNAYAEASPEAWMNRAIAAAFEPGSTFKLVTIAGALEERLTRPDEVIDCQMGSINVFGMTIRDHTPFGMLPVTRIMSNSSDVGAIKLGLRLGDERMYRYMRALGFGAPTGVGLPGEARGLTKPPERWSKVSIGAISMGQEVGVTALQLLNAVSAIANGGRLVRPRIVRETFRRSPQQRIDGLLFAASRAGDDSGEGRQALSPETANEVRRMMREVVVDGTGKKAQLNGWSSAGKTGTAQKLDPKTGTFSKTDLVASFVGFAPVNNPAVAIVVVLDSPRGEHHGGAVAAPVFARIAEQVLAYLEVPRDIPTRSQKTQPQIDAGQLIDFAPPEAAEAAAPPPAPRPVAAGSSPSESTVLVDLDGALKVPDFRGKSARAVAEQAMSLGLEVELVGAGVARDQVPQPGATLSPGTRIAVYLSR